MSDEVSADVTNSIFGVPRNSIERAARRRYRFFFFIAKSLTFALTVASSTIPETLYWQVVLLLGMIVNWLLMILLAFLASEETRTWRAGGTPEPKAVKFSRTVWRATFDSVGLRSLLKFGRWVFVEPTDEKTALLSSSANIEFQKYSSEISAFYQLFTGIKKLIGVGLIVLNAIAIAFPRQLNALRLASSMLSGFSAIVLLDLIDAYAREESRLQREEGAPSTALGQLRAWLPDFGLSNPSSA